LNGLTIELPQEQQVQLALPCDATSVGIARNTVATLARRLGVEVDDVKIAVSEAVANAVIHAYRGGERGPIRVAARHERGRLLVTVEDDGMGMTPNPSNPGLRVGIPLITKLSDDVRFHSTDEGTVVSMSFLTPSTAGARA
jgi:anti-sigma regulatory factor (Ser/Thr protein kinase)